LQRLELFIAVTVMLSLVVLAESGVGMMPIYDVAADGCTELAAALAAALPSLMLGRVASETPRHRPVCTRVLRRPLSVSGRSPGNRTARALLSSSAVAAPFEPPD
jgi:hypothetical protein